MNNIIKEEPKKNILHNNINIYGLEGYKTLELEDPNYLPGNIKQEILTYINISLESRADFISEYPQRIDHLFTLKLEIEKTDFIHRFYLPVTPSHFWLSTTGSNDNNIIFFSKKLEYYSFKNDGIKIRAEKRVIPNDGNEEWELPYKEIDFDFFIDSEMYYDSIKGETILGEGKRSEKALLVPFNSESNEDRYLEFNFSLHVQYPLLKQEYDRGYRTGRHWIVDFRFKNKINNTKKLIGEEGKYHFANYS